MTTCKYTRFGFACERRVRMGDYCWQHRPPTPEQQEAARAARRAESKANEERLEREDARRELEREAGVRPDQIATISDFDLRHLVTAGGLDTILETLR